MARPDEGVMVELGAAIAESSPSCSEMTRRCTDSEDYPELDGVCRFAGTRMATIVLHVDDVGDPTKALALWIASWRG